MTTERDNRIKGSRHEPAKGRRIPAIPGGCEAGIMCITGLNEVHEVARTRGQLA